MTKHTMGPWRANDTTVFQDNPLDSVVVIASCGGPALKHEEHQADARLIAAAPDLLEAAKLADDYFKQIGYEPTNKLKIITDAIRKAEGQ